MMSSFTEWVVEEASLAWFGDLSWLILHGPAIAPGEPSAERDSYEQVVLKGRLRNALASLNPSIPAEALDEAFRKLTRIDSPSLVDANAMFHHWLVNGVPVEYLRLDGSTAGDLLRVVDFDQPEKNDWLAVNQLLVEEQRLLPGQLGDARSAPVTEATA